VVPIASRGHDRNRDQEGAVGSIQQRAAHANLSGDLQAGTEMATNPKHPPGPPMTLGIAHPAIERAMLIALSKRRPQQGERGVKSR
jgi:hypothetical protein